MNGKLYVVGTPIGNLGDMSERALETLRMVDFIAAEDTRVTAKLLSRFEISKPMVSYYQHNLRERGEQIVARIAAGENCAVVTDAGMPCISDPGEDLVRLCAEAGVETVVVPGPSAAVAALAVSGLATSRFCFEGFLSVNRRSRAEHLEGLRQEKKTLIFYEAPHKLVTTLRDLYEAFGDRRITLARELTKLHEEVIRTSLAEVQNLYIDAAPRGEYVLVVEGAAEEETAAVTFEEAAELVRRAVESGESLTSAAKAVAKETGFRKGDLYRAALE